MLNCGGSCAKCGRSCAKYGGACADTTHQGIEASELKNALFQAGNLIDIALLNVLLLFYF